MNFTRSKELFERAKKRIPGGVNSPVRAFQSVHREAPIFVKKGKGSKVWDEDGNMYLDFICSWGPLILGHNHEIVSKAVLEIIENGSSYGLPTAYEVELAELICETVPSIEKVRLTSSGTEATMSAVRLARAYTRRNGIVKFEGCYHGHSDALLVKSGSGLLTEGYQDSNGIPEGVLENTKTVPFGDFKALEELLETREMACIIMEPIPANMGVIETHREYLAKIRELCTRTETVLIFDEVISGFRASLGGAQEYFGITPDLTTLGKIIGGGYPVGAFGGKSEIMDMVAPLGRVYHAGTLSGNPISVKAGLATLKYLKENKDIVYPTLEKNCNILVTKIQALADKHGIDVCVNSLASLFTIFFTDKKEVKNLGDSLESNTEDFSIYFNTMLEEGIILPPSQFEAHFISYAHTVEDFEFMLKAMDKAFAKIKKAHGDKNEK